MTEDKTRADSAGSSPWVPRKAVTGGVIGAEDRVGKSIYSENLRRFVPGDRDMGQADESLLEGWAAKECAPGHWVADTDQEN